MSQSTLATEVWSESGLGPPTGRLHTESLGGKWSGGQRRGAGWEAGRLGGWEAGRLGGWPAPRGCSPPRDEVALESPAVLAFSCCAVAGGL